MNSTIPSETFFTRDFGKHFYRGRKRPLLIGVDLKTPENIGALLRLAGNIGADKVIIAAEQNTFKEAKIKKTATTAYHNIPLVFNRRWWEEIPDAYITVAIETASAAHNLYESTLPETPALVVGNERHGLSESDLLHCRQAVYIPLTGSVLSVNVIQAAAIASFEWLRQQLSVR